MEIVIDFSQGPRLLSWWPTRPIVVVIVAVVSFITVTLAAVIVIWAVFHFPVICLVPLRIDGRGNCIRLPIVVAQVEYRALALHLSAEFFLNFDGCLFPSFGGNSLFVKASPDGPGKPSHPVKSPYLGIPGDSQGSL